MENIDEVKQINFLTTSTTKWHRCYRVNITFFNIHQKTFRDNRDLKKAGRYPKLTPGSGSICNEMLIWKFKWHKSQCFSQNEKISCRATKIVQFEFSSLHTFLGKISRKMALKPLICGSEIDITFLWAIKLHRKLGSN